MRGIATRAPDRRLRWILAGLLLLAAVLRLEYARVTPLDVRGHDIYAHTDYIDFMERERAIPHASDGWEYYQPPLYYVGAAAWSAGSHALGYGVDEARRQLQWISALLSLAGAGIAFAIGFQLFDPRKERAPLIAFCALLAVWPGLVLFSSRVSNDALHLPVSYASLLALLLWWKRGAAKAWYGHAALAGVGMLVKISAALQVPAALACVAVRPGLTPRRRVRLAAGLCAVVVALTAWYVAVRFTEPDTTSTSRLGNVAMDESVRLDNRPSSFLVFRPLSVLAFPYNSPWSDAYGRRFYWEYLFKSSLLGEWRFGAAMLDHARVLVALALGLLVLAAAGLYAELRRHPLRAFPVHVTLALLLAASMAYRFLFTCSCNQDFRFVPLLAVPFAYYAVRGTALLSGVPRAAAVQWIGAFVVAAAAFIFRLGLTGA